MALIRASGARLGVLHDHRLVELWREYSQKGYCCGWIAADRQEVYRFVTWSNNLCGISREILLAQRVNQHGVSRICSRNHPVRGWDNHLLFEKRLGSPGR